MKNLVLLLLFLSNFKALAQQPSLIELNNDLQFFKNALYDLHPSTFRYIQQDSLDNLFALLAFAPGDSLGAMELEKKMRLIFKQVGCIHTHVSKSVFKHNGQIIPFTIFNKKDKLWIKKDLADSTSNLSRSPIVSINGHPMKEILQRFKKYRSQDGHHDSFMDRYLQSWTSFSYLYQYYFDSDTVKTYGLVSPINYSDTIYIERRNIPAPQKPIQKEPDGQKIGPHIILSFDTLNQLAVLKIKSFSTVFPIIGRWQSKIRYKKAIKKVIKIGYRTLVLDLRDNLGGDASAGAVLQSFFIPDKYTYAVTKTKGPVFKYAKTSSKFGHVLNFIFGDLIAGRRPSLKPRFKTIHIRKNKHLHYEGQLFILINGFTASTASNTASILKYKSKAKLIGQETGGGENDLNAYYYPIIRLPNSKIEFRIPLYHINLKVAENTGSGVKPHFPISYSIHDILSETDLEMDKVEAIIQGD